MKTEMSASAINRCSRVHACPSARRQADCQQEGVSQRRRRPNTAITTDDSHLSEGHAEGLWGVSRRSGLRVVLQQNAVSLKNHIWLAADLQGSLGRGEAHGVLELPAISRHLRAAQWKEKLVSTVNSGKLFPSGDAVSVCVCVGPCYSRFPG